MIQLKNWLLLIAQVDVETTSIESEEDSADAPVLHGDAVEAQRREAGVGGDVSESFGDSDAEEVPEANIKASKRTKVVMVETSESELVSPHKPKRPTPTRRSKRAMTFQASKSSASSAPVSKAGITKQKSSRPHISEKPTITPMEDPLGTEMHQRPEDLQKAIFKKSEVFA
ncbi:hypothetical protein FF1_028335 [Malus domestica]